MPRSLSLLLVVVLVLLGFSESASAIIRGKDTVAPSGMVSLSSRINAKYSSYPAHQCGGVLVAPRWVLTAAHCLFEDGSTQIPSGTTMDAVIGRTSLLSRTGERIAIIAQRSHPQYKRGDAEYDIGLLYLASASRNKPLSLGSPSSTSLRALGWGRGLLNTPWTLQEAYLQTASETRCRNLLGYYFTASRVICADDLQEKESICVGDSGGPLLSGGVVVGLSSLVRSGYNCFNTTFPSLFTRVDAHTAWIQSQLASPPTNQTKAPAAEGTLRDSDLSSYVSILSGGDVRVRTSPNGALVAGARIEASILRTTGYLQSAGLRIVSGTVCSASPAEETFLQHSYSCWKQGTRIPTILINGGKTSMLWVPETSCRAEVRFEASISNRSSLYREPYSFRLC